MPGNSKDIRKSRFITLLSCVIWFVGFYAFAGVMYFSGLRVNVTSSLPQTFWIVSEIDEIEEINSGDYVVVNPHEIDSSDFSPSVQQRYFGDRWLFIKQIGGVPGNVVQESCDVVVFSVDSEGNALPKSRLPVYLNDNEYWLVSDKERGFDSRYFGAVNRSVIKAKAFPLFKEDE